MSLPVQLSLAAGQDIREITEYYLTIRSGLARKFLEHFDRACDSISAAPESYDPISATHRRAFIARFPHVVYFRVAHDKVTVLAVLHSARSPQTWMQRLAEG